MVRLFGIILSTVLLAALPCSADEHRNGNWNPRTRTFLSGRICSLLAFGCIYIVECAVRNAYASR